MITTVTLLIAAGTFPWFALVQAGSVSEVLATESRPFLWLAAFVASPFAFLIGHGAVWRMFSWKGVAIFVQNNQLWLWNRWRPLPLAADAAFELTDPIALIPGLPAWPPHLAMQSVTRSWKYPLPRTVEIPAEVLSRLREHVSHLGSPPPAPLTPP